jgi:predicted DsbA family dithiol-disulfide isomerase
MNPYCNNCYNLLKIIKNGVTTFKCVSFAKTAWNGSKLDPNRHTELEIDEGLVLKCPECMRAEERLNKGVK